MLRDILEVRRGATVVVCDIAGLSRGEESVMAFAEPRARPTSSAGAWSESTPLPLRHAV